MEGDDGEPYCYEVNELNETIINVTNTTVNKYYAESEQNIKEERERWDEIVNQLNKTNIQLLELAEQRNNDKDNAWTILEVLENEEYETWIQYSSTAPNPVNKLGNLTNLNPGEFDRARNFLLDRQMIELDPRDGTSMITDPISGSITYYRIVEYYMASTDRVRLEKSERSKRNWLIFIVFIVIMWYLFRRLYRYLKNRPSLRAKRFFRNLF